MNDREQQEKLYNEKYGYRQRSEPEGPRPLYRVEGRPGAWEIIRGIQVIDRCRNHGQALSILRGLNNHEAVRKTRYTFRKVYLYLQAVGWRIEHNDPPDVFWTITYQSEAGQWCSPRVKENRLLGPKEFLLAMMRHSRSLIPNDREILQGYWTWHRNRVRRMTAQEKGSETDGNQDRNP